MLWAFERIGTPSVGAEYGFYYDAIKGMAAFKAGKSKVISGIKTPDLKTISFTLTKPTGDFLYRLTMPATGPQPQEVSGCFTQPNEYGRYVISSGPYMIAGSDKLNASSCDTIKASGGISGFDGEKVLDLVRNPDYNPATDSPKARENFPDEFTFTVNSNTDDIYARVGRGDIEEEVASETPSVLRQYHGSPQLHTNDGDRTWYLTMNLTQPPFDDVHVRRAVNFVVDRDALRKAWGGASAGAIATHIAPDAVLNNELKGYAPYGNGTGDLAKAKAEMKLSKYDKNHDGICDASACKNLLTDHRCDRGAEGPRAAAGAEPQVDRHHHQGPRPQGRVHPDPDGPQQHPVLDAARLGQGLRRRPHVLRPALRRSQHHRAGQHQLLPARHHPRDRQEGRRQGQHHRRPEHQRRSRQVQPAQRQAACQLLCGARQEAHDADRAVGALPLVVRPERLEHERHQVRLRPVRRHHRLRARGDEVRTDAPARAPRPSGRGARTAFSHPHACYILRRLVWAVLVLLAVTLITFFIFYKLPPGDPALRFVGKQPTPENIALVRHRLGLDKPFYVQYAKF